MSQTFLEYLSAKVHKMLPMTLGANIGTTFTALLAALAVLKHDSLQIAFCSSSTLGGDGYIATLNL